MYDRPTTNHYDEFIDQMHRTSQLSIEVTQLSRRQSALEAFIRALVERHLDAGGRCRLGECTPAWDPSSGRHVHVGPCSLAAGEQLLRETVKTRVHYGTQTADSRPPDAGEALAPQGHASNET